MLLPAPAAAISFVRKIYRNELDKMMAKFKKTQPDFYVAYFNARIIIDRPGSHAAPMPRLRRKARATKFLVKEFSE